MKCNNCGFELEENVNFCPNCSMATAEAQPISLNPAGDVILNALRDKLFLVLCIFMSVATILGFKDGVPLLNILYSIFLWLLYAKAYKGEADCAKLRNLSGTVFAAYILNYVLFGIIFVLGIILAAAVGFIANDPDLLGLLEQELANSGLELTGFNLADILPYISGGIVVVVFGIISLIGIFVNAFSMRYIHRFAKSVYQSVDSGVLELKSVKGAKNWLLVFGIVGFISAVANLFNGDISLVSKIASAASGLCPIFAFVLIQKHIFVVENY